MKIIYTKFSNDRRAEYSIRTNILLGEDGKKYIEKLQVQKAILNILVLALKMAKKMM